MPRQKSNTLFGLIAVIALAYVALHLVQRLMFPMQSAATDRLLNMNSVGWAGIGWDGVTAEEQKSLGARGAVVLRQVAPNGPAGKAGVKSGDYLVGVNGQPFSEAIEVQAKAKDFAPGQKITFNLVRDGKELDIEVCLASYAEVVKNHEIDGMSL